MAKIKKFSNEDLERMNKEALEKFEEAKMNKGRKIENEEFLSQIKSVLKTALDKQIPFTQIAKILKETYNINVSVGSIKTYAKRYLNYVPKSNKRGNEIKKESVVSNTQKQEQKADTNERKKSAFNID